MSPRSRPIYKPLTEAEIQAELDQIRSDRWREGLERLPGTLARWALVALLAPISFIASAVVVITMPIWFLPYLFVMWWREEPEFRADVRDIIKGIQALAFWWVVGRLCGWW